MEEKNYIQVLIQGLDKKIKVLQQILEENDKQEQFLLQDEVDVDEWEALAEKKTPLIEELEFLDQGFSEVYEHVKEELHLHRDVYQEEIKKMQERITNITELSVQIQASEARNKQRAQVQFAKLKKRGRTIHQSSHAARLYSNNMKKLNLVDPQFLDRKN